ncbi:MAG: ribosome-associated ATPase/putative transporter RbbA [Filomicrobium sp.]
MDQELNVAARAENLTHRYGKTQAIEKLGFELPANRKIGIIGPDGVGKSTLIGLIAGARQLQIGKLEVLGADLSKSKDRNAVGPRIAYMPQGLGKNLYADLSIAENLHFFGRLFGQSASERTERIDNLTRATGLRPFLDRPAGKLSGGMKQKLGLCCSLIHEPDLLVLDEPTTGVDPLSRRQFWELIDEIKDERSDMTLLVSTAYMDEANQFDWLLAMNAGKIIGTGSPQELKDQAGVKDLEAAYVAMLPSNGSGQRPELIIPPRQKQDGEAAIVANGLTRRFGSFTAVDNVDLTIERGEIFGFLGSNGCGKSTTMKMLTGLLPPSAGKAFLFGQAVDAGSIAIRRRVGYMSQAFSLYGELTVRQNFTLHSRLFHLEEEYADARIEHLTKRFGLERYENELAGGLPLGVRQRLSLAVAILHEPEMLILDEPTSGVDPVARDDFWRVLVELSRDSNVTIFVSTHFMNEALRCDRISLMHAGCVLAVGTPDELVERKQAPSLESAFISYMEEAIGPDDEEISHDDQPEPKLVVPETVTSDTTEASPARAKTNPNLTTPKTHMSHHASGLSLTRLWAYSLRETMEILRDPIRLGFAFIGSTILLFIFSYGITTDVNEVAFAVLDNDRTPASRAYIQQYDGSRYFKELEAFRTKADFEERLRSNDVTVALEIPPKFGRQLAQGTSPEVSAWIDGANPQRAATIEGYVSGVHNRFIEQHAKLSGYPQISGPAEISTRSLYNPTFESIYAIGPSVPAMLLILFPAILMAISVVREKEIGTITNFYVTPSHRIEFLVGKQLPYIGITMVNFAIMALIVVYLFGVPLKGSLFALSLGALAYAAATTGYGLLIATFTSSQVAAVFATAILSLMPTFLFSGFLQPVSSLEGGARVIGTLWPTTYYMHLSVGAFTKGLQFTDLATDILALTLFVPVFIAISAFFLRKQEK